MLTTLDPMENFYRKPMQLFSIDGWIEFDDKGRVFKQFIKPGNNM